MTEAATVRDGGCNRPWQVELLDAKKEAFLPDNYLGRSFGSASQQKTAAEDDTHSELVESGPGAATPRHPWHSPHPRPWPVGTHGP